MQHGLLLGLAFNHAYAKSLEIGTHSLRRHPSKASRAEDAHHLVEAVARRGANAPPCAAVHISLVSFFKIFVLKLSVQSIRGVLVRACNFGIDGRESESNTKPLLAAKAVRLQPVQ